MAEPARKLDEEYNPYDRQKVAENNNSADSSREDIIDISNKTANDLNEVENNSSFSSNSNNITDVDSLRAIEDSNNGEGGFVNNFTGNSKNSNKKAKAKFFKNKGPLTAILLTIFGGGIGIGALLSPSLLFIQIKEMMVEKFNTQLASMDVRTAKIYRSKVLGSVGICGTTVNIMCKYKSISAKQLDRLEKAGIKVNYDEAAVVSSGGVDKLKRVQKVQSFEFKGESIPAEKFVSKMAKDVDFRVAVKKAYNPLYASFADKIWVSASRKIGINEDAVKLSGDTDEEKLASVVDEVKSPDAQISSSNRPGVDDLDEDGSAKYSGPDDPKLLKDQLDFDNIIKNVNEGITETAEDALKAVTKNSVGDIAKTVGSGLSITGMVDNVCTAYGTIRAVGFAAKTIRALQLARYAMIFLTIADQIKAGGNPDPKDVEYLGNVLTKKSAENQLTATDSYGYKYAAFGDVNKTMPDTATQFLAGAGLAGSLIGVTTTINTILGKTPNTVCKLSNNIFVQIGSLVLGIAIGILSGGTVTASNIIASASIGIAFSVALAFLPSLLQDIIAGKVIDTNTVGDLAGDAITSGSSSIMSISAQTGGNAPLTVDQAVAYNNLSKKVALQYQQEDIYNNGNFDITNKNTLIGSIYNKLIPYLSNTSSVTGVISNLLSLPINSLASLSPITNAAGTTEEYSVCQDLDYQNMGLAADPFCNLIYGMPTEYLDNIDPDTVANYLINSNQINAETGEINSSTKFMDFKKACYERENPIGYTGSDFSGDPGDVCILGTDKQMSDYPDAEYYYLYLIDQRVLSGMEGDDESLNTSMESGLDSNIAFYNGSNGIDSNVANNIFSEFFNRIGSFLNGASN